MNLDRYHYFLVDNDQYQLKLFGTTRYILHHHSEGYTVINIADITNRGIFWWTKMLGEQVNGWLEYRQMIPGKKIESVERLITKEELIIEEEGVITTLGLFRSTDSDSDASGLDYLGAYDYDGELWALRADADDFMLNDQSRRLTQFGTADHRIIVQANDPEFSNY